MKKYLEFVNEGIFDFLKGGKNKTKKRKYVYASDRDMGDLIDEIKETFKPEDLKWEGRYNDKYWNYKVNNVKIMLKYRKSDYSEVWSVSIDNRK